MSFNLRRSNKKNSDSVGFGAVVLVIKDNCILLGKRKSDIGNGLYALPGGHLDDGESIEDCAIREVSEETNLKIDKVEEVGFEETGAEDDGYKSFVTMYYKSYIDNDDDLNNNEPDKSEDWEWYSVDALPSPLFGNIEEMVGRI